MLRSVLCLAAIGLAASSLSGCGPAKARLYPVTGSLKVNGKPAENALILLHPPATTKETVRPSARVKADGTFEVTSFEEGDGAEAGEYTITVEWRLPPKTPFDGNGPDQLQGAFSNPATSNLKATVNAGATSLAPIEIEYAIKAG